MAAVCAIPVLATIYFLLIPTLPISCGTGGVFSGYIYFGFRLEICWCKLFVFVMQLYVGFIKSSENLGFGEFDVWWFVVLFVLCCAGLLQGVLIINAVVFLRGQKKRARFCTIWNFLGGF